MTSGSLRSGARGPTAAQGRPGPVASAVMDMSIVICTLDRPEGLVRAVRSGVAQDDRGTLAYEIVIVDNSATANACALVRATWGDQPDFVRYLNEPLLEAGRPERRAHGFGTDDR